MSSLKDIPRDIQTNVICKVASNSVCDMLNLKATCNTLYQVGEEQEVYSVVNVLSDVDFYDWMMNITHDEAQLIFEERMRDSHNQEIILRDSIRMLENGVKNNNQNLKNILENLNARVRKGHHACMHL